ncbi:MAG: polysaccharide deacetylase family protein [Treponema sp.]|jgi:peptidoglycan/xylan/chitin deacetylase (PgdA/CDA1 family)|nr:polysaccharide deacetylase family protein [Treponema sp.]
MPFIFICICFFLASCAHQQTDMPPPRLPPSSEGPPYGQEEPLETPSEGGVERDVPDGEPKTPLAKALRMVKNNEVQKRWSAQEDDITVYADFSIEGRAFTVAYDMLHASFQGDRHFRVPFLLEALTTGESLADSFDWYMQDDEAGLLLSFDDDYMEAWERTFDLFDRYGARITFFVQGKPVDFAKQALARGHDVGYHTIHHYNLPKVPEAVFMEETTADIALFRNAGIPLRSFAYPYGLFSPWMHEVLFQSFTILRGYGVTFRLYDAAAIKQGYVAAKAIDTILYKNDDDFYAIITLMLRVVKFTGTILPLCTHNIADSADWGITPARLEYLLKTARELNVRFYCYKDFV